MALYKIVTKEGIIITGDEGMNEIDKRIREIVKEQEWKLSQGGTAST